MKFYIAKEVCEILHISRRTLQRYCREGMIKYSIIAQKVIISQDDLQEFIEAEKQKTLSQSQNDKEAKKETA